MRNEKARQRPDVQLSRTTGEPLSCKTEMTLLPDSQAAPSDQHGNSAENNERQRRRFGNRCEVRLHLHSDRRKRRGPDKRCQVLKGARLRKDRYLCPDWNRAYVSRQVRIVVRDERDGGRTGCIERTVYDQVT